MKKLIVFLIILSSCTATRNNHAVVRVLSNNTLTEKVGRVWEKSNPCVIDTVVQFKDGIEMIRYDTLWNDLINTVYDTATKIKTVTEFKTITKTVNKTDTIIVDKTDIRRLNLQVKDNMALSLQNDQIKADLAAVKKKLTKRTIEFYGLIALIGILILLKFYFKI